MLKVHRLVFSLNGLHTESCIFCTAWVGSSMTNLFINSLDNCSRSYIPYSLVSQFLSSTSFFWNMRVVISSSRYLRSSSVFLRKISSTS